MNRAEKIAAVEKMNEAFASTPHAVLTSFSGLTVNQANQLRSRIRQAGGRISVLKSRLAKRAAEGTPLQPLTDRLVGACALATHDADPVVLAKTLADFSKDNPQLTLLAGIVDAKDLLDVKGVKQLASLPALPEIRAQMLALIQTPATMLVRLLGTPGTQLARVVDANREKQEQGSE